MTMWTRQGQHHDPGSLYDLQVPGDDLTPEERAELHDLMSRTIKAGISERKARGDRVGKQPKIVPERDDAEIRKLRDSGMSVAQIAERYGVAARTVYDSLKRTDHSI